MANSDSTYPVIDLFAGPGGLGEGFASYRDARGRTCFGSTISIECDVHAHQTLLLRHFLRHFPEERFPDEYYGYLRRELTLAELYKTFPSEYLAAKNSALCIKLAPESHEAVRRKISRSLRGQTKWALVGGPPCQTHSIAGRSRMKGDPGFAKDERHFLYREYLKIIADHRPPVFVMENVRGLLSATVDGEEMISRILADLKRPKAALGQSGRLTYRMHSLAREYEEGGEIDPSVFLVNAADHGVPQARQRVFIVGVRADLNVRPGVLRLREPPSVRDTIGNLRRLRSGLSRGPDNFDIWRQTILDFVNGFPRGALNGSPVAPAIASALDVWRKGRIPTRRGATDHPGRFPKRHPALDSIYDSRLDHLDGHDTRSHMESDLHRYAFATAFAEATGRSPLLTDFPTFLLPKHKNVTAGDAKPPHSDRFRVQLPNGVANTIVSHISKDGHAFIHYDRRQCRSLTVREAARIQTFPDNYKFEGPRTSQYHQVGNAVPPYLARQIAEIVAEALDGMK